MLQPGTLIAGRYEIQSPLASGGNGLVYSCTDRTTEKRVAIKILGPHMLHERAAREKMRLEAIVAGRVESEHIVQVSDAGVDIATGIPFLVMELLKGQDLQHHIEQGGHLEPTLALEYLRQVASGLDKAHGWKDHDNRAAPIVHRDLKPENLFLTHREDGGALVKILDFGLAKVLSVSATLSSEIKGTPLYMAPEQFSQAPVTPATDIWALGLIAFFFLTAKCYWRSGQDDRAILPAVIKEVTDGATLPARARLRELGASIDLPEAFDEWFSQCVNLNPLLRFKSAGSAIKALSAALEQNLLSSPLAAEARALPSPSNPAIATTERQSGERLDRQTAASNTSANVTAEDTKPRSLAPLLRWVVAALVILVASMLVFSMRQVQPSFPPIQAPTAATQAAATNSPEVTLPATASAARAIPQDAPSASNPSVPERPEAKSTRVSPMMTAASPTPRVAPVTAVSSGRNVSLSSRPTDGAPARAPASNAAMVATAPLTRENSPATASSVARVPRDPADHR